jgi:HAD superfamily hydrolase (TIGR01549 family)
MIETVIFDLDGTLKVSVLSGLETFVAYARQVGLRVGDDGMSAGARWNHWYWARSPALMEDLATGDETTLWIRYSERLLAALGVDDATEDHARAITALFAGYAPESRLNDGARETLSGLQAAGYRLGLVSNRTHPLAQVVGELELDNFFDFTLAAGEVNLWKPDPAIFYAVAERGHCRPEHSLYVGDNYYADVVSSRAAGLTPVLLDPERIFPDADCRVIDGLTELLDWLRPRGGSPLGNRGGSRTSPTGRRNRSG